MQQNNDHSQCILLALCVCALGRGLPEKVLGLGQPRGGGGVPPPFGGGWGSPPPPQPPKLSNTPRGHTLAGGRPRAWNVEGSMRGDGVPVAPGMLGGEAVAAGIMKAEGAIMGLFQETGLQDPQGVVHSENQWRHHGYHAFPGVDAQAASAAAVRGGLLIALRADLFAAEEVRDVVDIVPGKAMALDVVTAGGTLTVANVHGPGSGGDSWVSKASFWADLAMYAAAKSARGTRAVLLGGEFNVWLESPGDPTTRRF